MLCCCKLLQNCHWPRQRCMLNVVKKGGWSRRTGVMSRYQLLQFAKKDTVLSAKLDIAVSTAE